MMGATATNAGAMSQMLKSSGAIGIATLTSRVLGMVREIVYANFMGDGAVASAFKFAFSIPNLFRRLLGEGALTAAFIPIFKEQERTAGEAEMWRAGNAVISGLVAAGAVVVAVVLLGISLALATLPLGEETRLMLRLLRVMFPYMPLICLTAIFMGMLNSRGQFFVPALGAALMNVVMIGAVFWVTPLLGEPLNVRIFGLAIGALLAGAAQAAYQLPNLRREGFRYRWVSPWRDATVREVVRKMVPGMLGVAAFQLNVLLTNVVAFNVGGSILASFDYAVRLMELPQGVFGLSLATYLLPTLSGMAAEKKWGEFRGTLRQGLGYLLFVNALASVLLVVLAVPVVRLLFERGQFGPDSTRNTALALVFLAPGLLAFSMVNILGRAFYALGDTHTPMRISIFCLVSNLILAFALVHGMRQAGLGLANTISSCVNVGLLIYALRRKLGRLDFAPLRRQLAVVLLAGAAAGAVAWWGGGVWERNVGHASLVAKVGAVFAPAGVAAMVYWLVAVALKLPTAWEVTGLAMGRLRGRKAAKIG